MSEKTISRRRFVPYKLTATWFSELCRLDPNSDSFTTDLISKKTETTVDYELIGYNDVVEYMMCNDGEYPPGDVPCHGETRPVNVVETTYRMNEHVADLVKSFCLKSDNFSAFCKFMGLNDVDLTTEFSHVRRLGRVSEISAKHIPKKMFVFPGNVKVNRPKFWLSSPHAYTDKNHYSHRVIVVQPNRNKQEFLMYEFDSSLKPNSNNFFATAYTPRGKKKRIFITKTSLVTDSIVISSNRRLYIVAV